MSYHRPDFTPPQPHFAAAPMAYYSTAARKDALLVSRPPIGTEYSNLKCRLS